MNREKALAAADEGIAEAIRDLAKREASNEVTEAGDIAAGQFERGLRCAKDAGERAAVIVRKMFTE